MVRGFKISNAAIIVAAGRGERIGSPENGPKQYRIIDDKAIISHTVEVFLESKLFSKIILVIHKDDITLCQNCLGELSSKVEIVFGGKTRQISTLNGLLALEDTMPEYVFIHDGVRPFIDILSLQRIHNALSPNYGILLALPVSDTLKQVDDKQTITKTLSREKLYFAQTPQAFPFKAILKAHKLANQQNQHDFTDDCSIAEWANMVVKIVQGHVNNFKITWPEDILKANKFLEKAKNMYPDIRTGNGYDVHSFEAGDHVTLCGVKIPYETKLNGHSDADVALHALTDALLATRGAGDIGTHFPPSDPQWKGASSDIFVRHAVSIIKKANGRIINIDITLIAEEPKIGVHREEMTNKLMDMLGISYDRISIKATTNEKMGFVGRKEGIAAIATANVAYPGEVPECL